MLPGAGSSCKDVKELLVQDQRLMACSYRFLRRNFLRIPAAFWKPYSKIYYVSEWADWVIHWIGQKIARHVSHSTPYSYSVIQRSDGIRKQVVHFGSRNMYFGRGSREIHPSNRVVFTWYHGSDTDSNPSNLAMIRALPECVHYVEKIVTASNISKSRLIEWGVPEAKIASIPLGVDLGTFKPAVELERRSLRAPGESHWLRYGSNQQPYQRAWKRWALRSPCSLRAPGAHPHL